jgi:DNA-binding MarR family transcriptional regulator
MDDARLNAPSDLADAVASEASGRLTLGPLGNVLGFHLAKASVFTFALFEQHVGQPLNLRKVEFSLLMLLLANGPLSPKRLAQALALSAPALTSLLDRLQDRGLLLRERSQVDRRSQNIRLTDDGLQLAEAAAREAAPMEQAVLQRLSVAERAMLIELLGKVGGR